MVSLRAKIGLDSLRCPYHDKAAFPVSILYGLYAIRSGRDTENCLIKSKCLKSGIFQ